MAHPALKKTPPIPRRIVQHTRGHGEGFITRLMSPTDLGWALKPFVFLDIFDADRAMLQAMERSGGMPIHPHSGVATTGHYLAR
jgi:redox-sensitive bicupin YhaK (pirin superfamily)